MAYLAVATFSNRISLYRCGSDNGSNANKVYEHVGQVSLLFPVYGQLRIHGFCFAGERSFVIVSFFATVCVCDITEVTAVDSARDRLSAITTINIESKNRDNHCIYFDGIVVKDVIISNYSYDSHASSGTKLVVRSAEFVAAFDVVTRHEMWRVEVPSHIIRQIYFAQNEEFIVTCFMDKDDCDGPTKLRVLDAVTGLLVSDICTPIELGSGDDMTDFAFHPFLPIAVLVSAQNPDIISLLHLSSDYCSFNLASEECCQLRVSVATETSCIKFSSCGTKLLAGSSDELIRVWNTSTWEQVLIFPATILCYEASYNSSYNHIACADRREVVIFDCDTGALVQDDINTTGTVCYACSDTVVLM
jgi:WD40 repeat protein